VAIRAYVEAVASAASQNLAINAGYEVIHIQYILMIIVE
jgi:hypothetical protein